VNECPSDRGIDVVLVLNGNAALVGVESI